MKGIRRIRQRLYALLLALACLAGLAACGGPDFGSFSKELTFGDKQISDTQTTYVMKIPEGKLGDLIGPSQIQWVIDKYRAGWVRAGMVSANPTDKELKKYARVQFRAAPNLQCDALENTYQEESPDEGKWEYKDSSCQKQRKLSWLEKTLWNMYQVQSDSTIEWLSTSRNTLVAANDTVSTLQANATPNYDSWFTPVNRYLRIAQGVLIAAAAISLIVLSARIVWNIGQGGEGRLLDRIGWILLGVLLGKYGFAEVAMPGGCNFGGVRPIDQHIKGFEALGAKVTLPKGGYIRVEAPEDGLHGAHIYFDVVTVGATMNIMLAAVLAKGQTIMENCAKEPHIVDLANFLNAMGADVKGAGTDVIKIRGVESLHGGSYSIIPDQIEAGTFMAAVAACGGSVLVKNVIPRHLECITAKLREMSVEVTEFDDAVLVRREGKLTKTNIKTLPYPGFPTDMQPQMTTALCLAEGTSIITEGIWGSRYRYTEELTRMGANIHVDGAIAVVEGVRELNGAPVRAHDLRAGAAMVIAGLAAKGVTEVEQVQNIERGYETLVEKFVALGADMYRSEIPESAENK